jgi:hypothetical protein
MSAAASSVPRRSLGDRLWSTAMVVLIAFFVVNVFGVITSVTVSSFATRYRSQEILRKLRFALDSPLEEGVTSELVSGIPQIPC